MRVILDTNVLMSAVFFGGIPGRLLSAWAAKRFTLVLSLDIFDEYRRVGRELARRYPALEKQPGTGAGAHLDERDHR
ncbi:MAG: PIN domain-containing protein [Gammaproteobacteria bacterium]|nr:PIN domain-containing protein [Gammaproteobacteria bacterium]